MGVTSAHRVRLVRELVLDPDYLKSFGELLVPEPIWRALTRFNVWIEPALVAEWIRIMKDYSIYQGRLVAEEFYRVREGDLPECNPHASPPTAVNMSTPFRIQRCRTRRRMTSKRCEIRRTSSALPFSSDNGRYCVSLWRSAIGCGSASGSPSGLMRTGTSVRRNACA
jgi:hypothetical protein